MFNSTRQKTPDISDQASVLVKLRTKTTSTMRKPKKRNLAAANRSCSASRGRNVTSVLFESLAPTDPLHVKFGVYKKLSYRRKPLQYYNTPSAIFYSLLQLQIYRCVQLICSLLFGVFTDAWRSVKVNRRAP